MTETAPARPTRELACIFQEPGSLEACIKDLLAAGFDHGDLSVLSSHEAIEAADSEGNAWRERLMPLLTEKRYEVPLVTGTIIALTAGPVGAAIAGLTAAGVGALALREIFQEFGSLPDTDEFAEAVEQHEIVFWVAVPDANAEAKARDLLTRHGARNIRIAERHPTRR